MIRKAEEIAKIVGQVPNHDILIIGKNTNADRIRAMTDEELAEWLEFRDDNCPRVGCYKGGCHECWLDWLKSPVEVDE